MRLRRPLLAAVLLAALLPAEALAVSWGTTVKLTSTRNAAAWSGLTTTGTAHVHAVYQDASGGILRVFYRHSGNSGATWDPALQLSSSSVAYSDGAVITSTGSRVDVVWRDESATTGKTVLKYKRSADHGATWSGTLAISSTTGSAGIPTVAHEANGRMIVAWTETSNGAVKYRRSTDHGATWSGTTTATSTINQISPGTYEAYPAAAAGSGILYLLWAPTDYALAVRRSTNGGASWSTDSNLSLAWAGDLPSIAASGSAAIVAFSEFSDVQIWATTRRSANKGSSWAAAVPLTSPTMGGPSFGPIVRWAGSIWRVTLERCATLDCLASSVYYRSSSDGGASWSSMEKVSTTTRPYASPAGVAFAGKVVVMYYDWNPALLDSDIFVRVGS